MKGFCLTLSELSDWQRPQGLEVLQCSIAKENKTWWQKREALGLI
jgi:hypothetical protein